MTKETRLAEDEACIAEQEAELQQAVIETKAEQEAELQQAVIETKADAFKRVANFRLEKTISRMRQFPALANTGNYEYTKEQVEFILKALDTEVQAIEDAFKGTVNTEVPQL